MNDKKINPSEEEKNPAEPAEEAKKSDELKESQLDDVAGGGGDIPPWNSDIFTK